MQKAVLITGGAGYVGSHIAHTLAQIGYSVIIIDSFVHEQRFNHSWATVYRDDFSNTKLLSNLFNQYAITAVIHCAASIEVGLSMGNPIAFYENNVAKTIVLLKTMLKHNIYNFIFSSSCAVYGIPETNPIPEEHPLRPISPYGQTKKIIENILQDLHNYQNLNYCIMRYFNVAGAYPEKQLGEFHNPETHLIPLLFQNSIEKKPFTIFGADYETRDGTALRDYIHVRDIATAHLKALLHLEQSNPSDIFNIGTGKGITVKEIVEAVELVTKQKLPVLWKPRRSGDSDALVADPSRAHAILQWQPQFSDINFILKSTYAFEAIKYQRQKDLERLML